jgi:hypothetical protein
MGTDEVSDAMGTSPSGRARTAGLKRALSRVFQTQPLRELATSSGGVAVQSDSAHGVGAAATVGHTQLFGAPLQRTWDNGAHELLQLLFTRLHQGIASGNRQSVTAYMGNTNT